MRGYFVIAPIEYRALSKGGPCGVLQKWLVSHQQFRVAVDADCECDEDIADMRKGYSGPCVAFPNVHHRQLSASRRAVCGNANRI
jgi:hypothetical protein